MIGLDVSLTCTGVAGEGWTDTIRPRTGLRGHPRLAWIIERVNDHIQGADLVVIEGPSFGGRCRPPARGSRRAPRHGPARLLAPQHPLRGRPAVDAAETDRLYALFHVIAHHGLRRGEAVGMDWENVSFEGRTIGVARETVLDGWKPVETDPKTEGSAADVKVDRGTIDLLRAHQGRQRAARLENRLPWEDTGKVFVQEGGAWLHPDMVSDTFRRIVAEAGLPPINLRDLRHGAAALVKAGGGDLHDAKVKLRHSTIVLTSNTYMELFEEYEEELAERSAAAVPRARKSTGAHAPLTQEGGE